MRYYYSAFWKLNSDLTDFIGFMKFKMFAFIIVPIIISNNTSLINFMDFIITVIISLTIKVIMFYD